MENANNSTLQTILSRRSCRAYESRQITDAELETVLTAGIWAPTGMGAQSPRIVAVQDKATRDLLAQMNAEVMGTSSDPFYGAPTVLVVLADADRSTCVEDGSLVIGNMLLAAESIGLGSCWIHRARQTFETEQGKALLKKWGVEGNYIGVGNCILGYPRPEGKKQAAPRKTDYVVYVK